MNREGYPVPRRYEDAARIWFVCLLLLACMVTLGGCANKPPADYYSTFNSCMEQVNPKWKMSNSVVYIRVDGKVVRALHYCRALARWYR